MKLLKLCFLKSKQICMIFCQVLKENSYHALPKIIVKARQMFKGDFTSTLFWKK